MKLIEIRIPVLRIIFAEVTCNIESVMYELKIIFINCVLNDPSACVFGKQDYYLLRPAHIKHLQVIFNDSNFLFFVGLIEVFKNHSNVHIDNNHEVYNDERNEECDGDNWISAVSIGLLLVI